MTCYNLVNNYPKPVRYIRLNRRIISNPPDSLVIENGLGYPKEDTPRPEYDPETEYLTQSWELREGVIVQVWTVNQIELPPEEESPEVESETTPESVEESNQENESEPESNSEESQ